MPVKRQKPSEGGRVCVILNTGRTGTMTHLMTVKQVSTELGVSRKRVYQMIQEGKLVSLRLAPRLLRITRESLEQFVTGAIEQEKAELGLDLPASGRAGAKGNARSRLRH